MDPDQPQCPPQSLYFFFFHSFIHSFIHSFANLFSSFSNLFKLIFKLSSEFASVFSNEPPSLVACLLARPMSNDHISSAMDPSLHLRCRNACLPYTRLRIMTDRLRQSGRLLVVCSRERHWHTVD